VDADGADPGLSPSQYGFIANCIAVADSPTPVDSSIDHQMFRTELVDLIDQHQELEQLAELMT
jgi:hypothetical protein